MTENDKKNELKRSDVICYLKSNPEIVFSEYEAVGNAMCVKFEAGGPLFENLLDYRKLAMSICTHLALNRNRKDGEVFFDYVARILQESTPDSYLTEIRRGEWKFDVDCIHFGNIDFFIKSLDDSDSEETIERLIEGSVRSLDFCIVSESSFTHREKELSERNGVLLIDRTQVNEIPQLISKHPWPSIDPLLPEDDEWTEHYLECQDCQFNPYTVGREPRPDDTCDFYCFDCMDRIEIAWEEVGAARKDAENNQLVCPKCNSSRVKKGFDFKHGDQCPKCEAGVLMTESCECPMF